MLAAEWWWIAPTAVGAGAVASVGVRRSQRVSGRRLAYDAARQDLAAAQQDLVEQRRAVKVARAEHVKIVAERAATRAGSADVARARRALKHAEQNVKSAAADVRARRVALSVARAEIPAHSQRDRYPLVRLRSAHDAVLARWMEYETDPAKQIAYPAMSDGKSQAMTAFFTALRRAGDQRPSEDSRVTPTDFAAYRDAVTELQRAFDVAEHTAKALASGRDPNATGAWQDTAHQVLTRSAEAIDKAAGAAASAVAAWNARRSPAKDEPTAREGEPKPKPTKIWPVPRRDDS